MQKKFQRTEIPVRIHDAAITICSHLAAPAGIGGADLEDVIDAFIAGVYRECCRLSLEDARSVNRWLSSGRENIASNRVIAAGRRFAAWQINEIKNNPMRWRYAA